MMERIVYRGEMFYILEDEINDQEAYVDKLEHYASAFTPLLNKSPLTPLTTRPYNKNAHVENELTLFDGVRKLLKQYDINNPKRYRSEAQIEVQEAIMAAGLKMRLGKHFFILDKELAKRNIISDTSRIMAVAIRRRGGKSQSGTLLEAGEMLTRPGWRVAGSANIKTTAKDFKMQILEFMEMLIPPEELKQRILVNNSEMLKISHGDDEPPSILTIFSLEVRNRKKIIAPRSLLFLYLRQFFPAFFKAKSFDDKVCIYWYRPSKKQTTRKKVRNRFLIIGNPKNIFFEFISRLQEHKRRDFLHRRFGPLRSRYPSRRRKSAFPRPLLKSIFHQDCSLL